MAVTNSYSSIFHVIFIYLVLFFSCYSNKLCIYGAATGSYHIIDTDMLLSRPTCSASTTDLARRSQGLQISHNGPCSPLGQHQKSPSSREIFLKDESRVRSMNNAQTLNSYRTDQHTDTKLGAGLPTSALPIGPGLFTVKVGAGSSMTKFNLIFDTGSDITWIQCKSCYSYASCSLEKKLELKNKLMFDPTKSLSYFNGSCISGSQNPGNIEYNDGSYSTVHYGCDTLFLQPSYVLPKFQFGCGQGNIDDFGNADGVLGLGQGQLSLTSQAASKFGKVFSYCLPSLKSSTGYLLFGEKARAKAIASSLKFTRLVKSTSFYFVSLIGISVANVRLDIDPSVFESPGTVIDSGTVITRLPPTAYSALQIAFNKSMSSRYPPAPALSLLLDTCYNLRGIKNVAVPDIVLHFGEGTDVNVHPSGILWKEKDLSQVCLAFAKTKSSGSYTIIGNQQQLTLQVFYDLEGGRVGFGANGCS